MQKVNPNDYGIIRSNSKGEYYDATPNHLKNKMHIIKFNDTKPDLYVSNLSFPITIVTEEGKTYKVIKTGEKVSVIKG